MEKTVFFFRRKPGLTVAEFGRHYIEHHAPLGTRLTRCLRGYTVNLVDHGGDGRPDAVTEHWVPTVDDLFTPSVAYASLEDFQAVLKDDRSFIGDFDVFVVKKEVHVVDAPPLDVPLGQPSPEHKVVALYPSEKLLPRPPAGVRRVVDNYVREKRALRGDRMQATPSDAAVIRMVWAAEPSALTQLTGAAMVVREFRFIVPPHAW